MHVNYPCLVSKIGNIEKVKHDKFEKKTRKYIIEAEKFSIGYKI